LNTFQGRRGNHEYLTVNISFTITGHWLNVVTLAVLATVMCRLECRTFGDIVPLRLRLRERLGTYERDMHMHILMSGCSICAVFCYDVCCFAISTSDCYGNNLYTALCMHHPEWWWSFTRARTHARNCFRNSEKTHSRTQQVQCECPCTGCMPKNVRHYQMIKNRIFSHTKACHWC